MNTAAEATEAEKPKEKFTVEKYFAWREMNNGHLTVPDEIGPYYAADSSLSDWHETKEGALESFKKFVERHKYSAPDRLVLIEVYRLKHNL